MFTTLSCKLTSFWWEHKMTTEMKNEKCYLARRVKYRTPLQQKISERKKRSSFSTITLWGFGRINGGVSIKILIIGQVKHGWTKSHHTNTKGMLEECKSSKKKIPGDAIYKTEALKTAEVIHAEKWNHVENWFKFYNISPINLKSEFFQ